MIRYDLICAEGHQFDSWFKDSATFDRQKTRGVLQCPVCASDKVEKALMTPGLPTKGNRTAAAALSPGDPRSRAVREAVRKLRRHVEANATYVGEAFAEEARRIHYKEAEERWIYGEATPAEAKLLHEEGIEVLPLPPAPDDHN